ncbi:hypothetical protein NFI95_02185 [Acetobacteraceae bacterium KSS8]|uniref:Uncharacterized protein n=1 Tax=Endosaccharibacter trunci TaxID=2812733 RepID=A0ABT1W315_9PROT|nr:hypothetical protein [Acetobacteraceae bacterium KSS8]
MRAPELIATSWHHAYGGGYGLHHGFGGWSWIGHMVISSIVHGLIYGMIFRLLRHLSLGEIVLLTVLVVGGLYLWNRNRTYQRW